MLLAIGNDQIPNHWKSGAFYPSGGLNYIHFKSEDEMIKKFQSCKKIPHE